MLVRLRYFEHHLGPTPTGPGHQMGLLQQSLCTSADPCWWKKNAVYTLLELKVHQVFFLLMVGWGMSFIVARGAGMTDWKSQYLELDHDLDPKGSKN